MKLTFGLKFSFIVKLGSRSKVYFKSLRDLMPYYVVLLVLSLSIYVYLQYLSEIRLYRLNKPIMIDIVLIIITGACYWIYYLCTIWSFFLCFIWIIINLIETVWGWQGRCVYMRAWHLQVHIGSHTCHTLVVIQASCVIHHRHTSYKTSISAYTCENSQLPKWWHGCGCWHCCRWWSWQHSYRNIHWSADSAAIGAIIPVL